MKRPRELFDAALETDDVFGFYAHEEKLQPVGRLVKQFVTGSRLRFATASRMDESWRELREPWERLRWARLHRTKFEKPIDAARSLNIKPGTFRTYEFGKADGGRAPPLPELQRICEKYRVSWSWVATGQGTPDDAAPSELQQLAAELAMKFEKLAAAKKDDAIKAVKAILDAYAS